MRLQEVTAEPHRPGAGTGFWAFAILLALVAILLGMRTPSWAAPDPAAHVNGSAQVAGNPHVDDQSQGDVPISSAWTDDDDDDDDDDGVDDSAIPRTELLGSLPSPSAVIRGTAALASRYQSFVSEPSTPPPRA